eukprot:7031778-Prymnesium_polylepis.2
MVPAATRSASHAARPASAVKMHAVKPRAESFMRRAASASEPTIATPSTGPNDSSRIKLMLSSQCVSSAGSKKRPPARGGQRAGTTWAAQHDVARRGGFLAVSTRAGCVPLTRAVRA